MEVTASELNQFIGAIKSNFMYQSSQLNKASKKGRKHIPKFKQPGDMMYLIVEELELVLQKIQNLPLSSKYILNIDLLTDEQEPEIKIEYEGISMPKL